MSLFALWNGPIATWSFADILILIIIVAAGIGITAIALRVFEITVPAWAIQIGWILVVAVVAVLAIRFLFSL